ncbi:putative Tyrocidine synthase 3 [Paratrimastix pyriformis]|uniref:Tyrocidine synthase 3 n=1 Tax=Paratrimastix pyriformis TaxID=342808 RepID=A0ABQ8UAR8_9EUKA|nr:putative Tyrocidine synthase 3 [Paratrimastix pyriformis]
MLGVSHITQPDLMASLARFNTPCPPPHIELLLVNSARSFVVGGCPARVAAWRAQLGAAQPGVRFHPFRHEGRVCFHHSMLRPGVGPLYDELVGRRGLRADLTPATTGSQGAEGAVVETGTVVAGRVIDPETGRPAGPELTADPLRWILETRAGARLLLPCSPTTAPPVATLSAAVPPADRLTLLCSLLAAALAQQPTAVGPEDALDGLGLSSIQLIQVRLGLAQAGWSVRFEDLFDAPTPRALADRLLQAPAPAPSSSAAVPPPPPAATASGPWPLSAAQRRIWFADAFLPVAARPAYHIAQAFGVPVDFDMVALGRALAALVWRHPGLRTVFGSAEGDPIQTVLDPAEALGRYGLLEEGNGTATPILARPLLLVVSHHIATDGWALALVYRELGQLYQQARADPGCTPAALAAQLAGLPDDGPAGYARWEQQQEQQGAGMREAVERCAGRLAGMPTAFQVPGTRPRPPTTSTGLLADSDGAAAAAAYASAHLTLALPPALCRALAAAASAQRCTPYMVLFAAFGLVLRRCSGSADFALGAYAANREWPGSAGCVGCFVNSWAVRLAGAEGATTVGQWVAMARARLVEGLDEQNIPFDALVKRLGVVAAPGGPNPLFQVSFGYRRADWEGASLSLTPDGLPAPSRGPLFTHCPMDLMVTATEGPGPSWSLRFEYQQALFDRGLVASLAEALIHMAGTLADPECPWEAPVDQLGLLSAPAVRPLVAQEAWRRPWQESPPRDGPGVTEPLPSWPDRCLHELFEAQAARTPEAIALVVPGDDDDDDEPAADPSGDSAEHGRPGPGRRATTLSYRDLDRMSCVLAALLCHRLLGDSAEAGAKDMSCLDPDTLVAICVPRGDPRLVAGILGILRAGGAYVPLDADHPASRVHLQLEDSGAQVVVVSSRALAAAKFPDVPAERLLVLDEALDGLAPDAARSLEQEARRAFGGRQTRPHHLAYVIYTSGSTGRPKGALLEHRNVTWLLQAAYPTYRMGPGDCWTLFHSCAFDVSVWELCGSLLFGGRLVLVPGDVARSPPRFAQLLRREAVSILCQIPSVFVNMLQYAEPDGGPCRPEAEGEPALFPAMRAVCFAGEALDPASVARFASRQPQTRIVNMYGITETCIHSTVRVLTPAELRLAAPGVSPIGTPVGDLRMYIVLPLAQGPEWAGQMRLCPVGVPGELVVGGCGVGRGYLNRPELTELRFARDPLLHPSPSSATSPQTAEWQGRLYRSGDLATLLPSGELVYGGRIDAQVKLRGFRVELGEIEAVLQAQPGVAQAAVVLCSGCPAAPGGAEGAWGGPHLVAHLVWDRRQQVVDEAPAGDRAPVPASRVEALREAMGRVLPSYMVPARFLALPRLPVAATGKVDRRGLAAQAAELGPSELVGAAGSGAVTAEDGARGLPQTPLEQTVLDCFAAILGLPAPSLGMDQSFFSSGGHSLTAIRLLEALRRALPAQAAQARLGLADIFQTAVTDASPFPAPRLPALAEAAAAAAASPLTSAQQRLWIIEQMFPGTALHNMAFRLVITGGFSATRFGAAFRQAARRHEALWMAFREGGDHDDQAVVQSPTSGEMLLVEAASLPTGLAGPSVFDQSPGFARDVREPFVLSRGPLVRARLAAGADGGPWYFQLVVHHLLMDGPAVENFMGEVGAAYRDGTEAPTVPVLQYPDYARWERRQSTAALLARHGAYWRTAIGSASLTAEVPGDLPRPAAPAHSGAVLRRPVPATQCAALRAVLASGRLGPGATVASVLLAVFGLLVGRQMGDERDFLVGTPVSVRDRPEMQAAVGLFLNLVPVRVRLADMGQTFADFHRETQAGFVEAMGHADLPFELLVDHLQAPRQPNRHPLFEVLFSHQRVRPDWGLGPLGPGLEASACPSPAARPARVDLWLAAQERGPLDLDLELEYATERFHPARMAALLDQYLCLLAGLLACPELPVGRAALVDGAHLRDQVTRQAAETAFGYPEGRCVHELVGDQCRRQPEAVAVVMAQDEEQEQGQGTWARLTYGQLDTLAEQLSDFLGSRCGARPDGLVAHCLSRSPLLPIAMLAIARSGAAELPLDPAHPDLRLRACLDQARPCAVLVDSEPVAQRLLADDRPVILLSRSEDGRLSMFIIGGQAVPAVVVAPRQPPSPASLAYVLFTSGSTGRPKCVALEHRGLLSCLWLPLVCGGQLHLLGAATARDPPLLARQLSRGQINIIQATPSLWRGLLAALDETQGPTAGPMELLGLCGGEAVDPELRRHLGRRISDPFNVYGPSETTIWSTCLPLRDASPDATTTSSPLSIGRPIGNTVALVVHPGLSLDGPWAVCPPGVPGELCLAGAGLARGYLGDPGLTAAAFVETPFLGPAAGRVYRTGDRCRVLAASGEIEFLGRRDDQIKLAGHRIELGEIESLLLAQRSLLTHAAVVLRPGPPDPHLVAYVQPAPGLPASALRDPLLRLVSARLPAAMVPRHLVILPQMPLNSAGKVDRPRLPSPPAGPEPGEAATTPPAGSLQSPTEAMLAGHWVRLLGCPIDQLGPSSDFFQLGGHSLLAIRLTADLRRLPRAPEIYVRDVFGCPTLAAMARLVEHAPHRGLPALVPRPAGLGAVPMAKMQRRFLFLAQLHGAAEQHMYHIVQPCRLAGPVDVGALRVALGALVERHEALRVVAHPDFFTVFRGDDGDRARLLDAFAERPFDLRLGPLVRFGLVPAEPTATAAAGGEGAGQAGATLVLVLHHIIADAWSVSLLLRDLTALYASARAPHGTVPPPPPPPALQYPDVCHWEAAHGSQRWAEDLQYWTEALKPCSAEGDVDLIPLDRPRPLRPTHAGALHRHLVEDPALVAGIHRVAAQAGATPYMVLAAAFAALLFRYTSAEEALRAGDANSTRRLVVGTPTLNRDEPGLDGVVGLFVNTLPLVFEVGAGMSFPELLGQTRTRVVEAFGHQGSPLEEIVERLRLPRATNRQPLFQVLFAYQPPAPPADSSSSPLLLDAQQLDPPGHRLAKYDLSLATTEVVMPSQNQTALQMEVEYSTELYTPGRVARLCGHFETLLRAVVGAATPLAVGDLALLSPPEAAQLSQWRTRAVRPLPDPSGPVVTVCDLVKRQGAQRPEAVALVDATGLPQALLDPSSDPAAAAGACPQWTYTQLLALATRFARRLRRLVPAEPQAVIGLSTGEQAVFVVGALGALLAGGCYVPLDAQLPTARLRFIAVDSGCRAVVGSAGFLAQFAGIPKEPVGIDGPGLLADPAATPTAGGDGDRDDDALLPTCIGRDRLAYLMNTSGSTGLPKAVEIEHGGLLNLVLSNPSLLGPADRVASTFSLAFDGSGYLLWTTLAVGGALVLLPREAPAGQSALLLSAAARQGATIFGASTHYTELIVADQAVQAAGLLGRPLRAVFFGGSNMTERQGLVASLPPDLELQNGYGPTETTVLTSMHRCTRQGLDPLRGALPAGLPLNNVQIFVLDEHQRELPVGLLGEVCVGGPCLARGYRNRPDLNAAAFVANPMAAGGRMYRTGDLGFLDEAGVLHIRGRADGQVKIRGYRVETGEVESALLRQPGILQAAVVPRATRTALVAYVVLARDDIPPDAGAAVPLPEEAAAQLRTALLASIPEYMVPDLVLRMAALPVGPTGKLHRAGLPPPPDAATATAASRPCRPGTESLLEGLWAEVLGLPTPFSPTVSFWAYGGHSLLAMRLAVRIREAAGVDLPLAALFEAPTIALLARRIDEIKTVTSPATIDQELLTAARGPRPASVPISQAQHRLWLLNSMMLRAERPMYNVPALWCLRGPLDGVALAAAFRGLLARHEALRTGFRAGLEGPEAYLVRPEDCEGTSMIAWLEEHPSDPTADPRPCPPPPQATAPPVPQDGDADDDDDDDEAARGGPGVRRYLEAEAQGVFDLDAPPLVRLRVVRLAAGLTPASDSWLVLLVMHHIIADGTSLPLICRDLAALYRHDHLAPLPVQYPDYARWQHGDSAAAQRLAEDRAYWAERMAQAPAEHPLPFSRPRPAAPTHRAGLVRRMLTGDLSERLRARAAEAGVTLYMLMLGAFSAVVRVHGGQEQTDLVLGTPVVNRPASCLADVVGFFVNTLPIRVQMATGDTASGLLAQIRQRVGEAFTHQGLPFEVLVEQLQVERQLNRNPVFQLMYAHQGSLPNARLALDGMACSRSLGWEGLQLAKFDLSLFSAEIDSQPPASQLQQQCQAASRIEFELEFDLELFDRPRAVGLLDHLESALQALVSHPLDSLQLGAFPALPPRVEAVILRQAATHPDTIAVRATAPQPAPCPQTLTYRQLVAMASAWVPAMIRDGRPADAPVVISLPATSVLLPPALLAVLLAGRPFLLLDPALPAARLQAILQSALFNLIFTSGSTGRPKGARVEHAAMLHRLAWLQATFPLGPGDAVLQKTPLTFDVAVWEFFHPWLGGAAVVLPSVPDMVREPFAVASALARERVSLLHMVPSLLGPLLDVLEDAKSRLPGLRWVISAGEPLTRALCDRLARLLPRCQVWNVYGPCEGDLTAWAYPGPDRWPVASPIPIGKPIPGTWALVLSESGRPVPPATMGELYFGGPGLAAGYLNRDETRRCFVELPWSQLFPVASADPPSPFCTLRLYRTGDLASYLPDGSLRYHGRRASDGQVKVHGQRVELAEVEAALMANANLSVRAAAVVFDRGTGSLVAFVQPARGGVPDGWLAGLRRQLDSALPLLWYRPAFCGPDCAAGTGGRRTRHYSGPACRRRRWWCTPAGCPREWLAGLWGNLFGVPPAQVHPADNFFALGGHSLLAMRLVVRIRRLTGLRATIRDIFEQPTVAGLTARLSALLRDSANPVRGGDGDFPSSRPGSPEPPPICVVDDTATTTATTTDNPHEARGGGPVPLTIAQRSVWLADRMLPAEARSMYNMPLCCAVPARLRVASLQQALNGLLARHRVLGMNFQAEPTGLPVMVAAMTREEDAPGPAYLVLTFHHLVCDGLSLAVVRSDLRHLYAHFAEGVDALEPLPMQFDGPGPDPDPRKHATQEPMPADLHPGCWRWPRHGCSLFQVLLAALGWSWHGSRAKRI